MKPIATLMLVAGLGGALSGQQRMAPFETHFASGKAALQQSRYADADRELRAAIDAARQLRIFTSAQAEAGRAAYGRTCGRCHTLTLMGRQGKPDERPPVSSLSEADQKFINNYNGRVPPLAGEAFLQHWGSKTAAQLVARFQEAKFSFDEAGITDDERIVDITAYVLQINGAKPGSPPLTRTADTIVSAAASNSAVSQSR